MLTYFSILLLIVVYYQIKIPIGQIILTSHHSGRIIHIHLNGHPPLHKTRIGSQAGKDLQTSQQ